MFIPVMKRGEKDEFFMIKNWHYKFWTHLVELRIISCTRTQKSKLIAWIGVFYTDIQIKCMSAWSPELLQCLQQSHT